MKRTILLLGLFALLTAGLHAQNMRAFISHKAYCTPAKQPYIEFSFIIGGESVQYAPDGQGHYFAEVEIQVDVVKDDSVVTGLHYILTSDLFTDSAKAGKPDFANINNLPVDNGDYYLHFTLKDLHRDSVELKYIDYTQIDFPADKISSSRISLYSSMSIPEPSDLFVKYGVCLPPLFNNYVPETQYVLPFAVEIYNTKDVVGADKELTAKCYIEYAENKLAAQPENIITKKVQSNDVILILERFNTFMLPSGNYNAVVELLDGDQPLFINKVFFQKSNPSVHFEISRYNDVVIDDSFVSNMTDRPALEEAVLCLYPIASTMEREFFAKRMKTVTTEQLQRYFYSFWLARNPSHPEEAWLKYKKMVDIVQERFGSVQVKGYRTDRGRVYLQYGQPNDILEIPSDPVTLPYEVWHYYYLDNQSNVKFVFYDPALVGNDYELLHSNKYGEPHDTNWKMRLVRKLQPQRDIYDPEPEDYFGGDINGNWRYH
ncbi:MAG: GWxTD domain-containing protein [Bacteroidales bacterium]|nr:GWxTD domain-containing protein [Bacteroidales bacterium]